MQPKNSVEESGQTNSDVFPMPNGPTEALPVSEQSVDTNPAESAESAPNPYERHLSDPEQQPSTASPTLPSPKSNQTVSQTATTPPINQPQVQADDDTPQIADDVDVIEKEWVDKAKQIIDQTRSHPYRQEQEVERLQQSYLKKRYGKDVSSAN